VVEESANGSSTTFLHEADLENHLQNNKDNEKDAATPAKPPVKAPAKAKAGAATEGEEPAEPPTRELASKKDYQLGQALNLLKGLQIMQNRP